MEESELNLKEVIKSTGIHLPFVRLFMKIAEPRVRRLFYFVAYIGLAVVTSATFFQVPKAIPHILGGMILVNVFAGFIVLGCLVCAITVLPGIWMFERAGLYLVGGGIAMYAATLLFLGASALVTVLPIVLIVLLAIRWLDIKEFLLAPREG